MSKLPKGFKPFGKAGPPKKDSPLPKDHTKMMQNKKMPFGKAEKNLAGKKF